MKIILNTGSAGGNGNHSQNPAHTVRPAGSPGFLAVRLSLYMGRDGAAVAEVRTRSLAALPRARQCATVQTGRPCRTL